MVRLGAVNQELFGTFPRFVGLVGKEMGDDADQFIAFDETTFNIFVDRNYGERNMYTRVSHLGDSGVSVVDKIFLDLDVDKEELGVEEVNDKELVRQMRNDRMRADEVLGEVVSDARSAARFIDEEMGWPAVGVYSGMGIHIHILTEPMATPSRRLRSTARMIESEADLSTLDEKGTKEGDYNRLCRVANCPRVDQSGEPLDLYTIPLSIEELKELETDKLLEKARSKRNVRIPDARKPELQVWDNYEASTESSRDDVETQPVGEITGEEIDERVEELLEDALRMPCMYKRIKSRNPDHKVRYNASILLFNCGLRPSDVVDIYKKLGWFDFDEEVTRTQLQNIWEEQYASMSCKTIQERGLCNPEWDTVEERRAKCPTYGWEGGDANWKK